MTTPTIKVRQKQYGIVTADMAITTLETKDIKTCTGLVGLHRDGKVAFMAHIDTPSSVLGLRHVAKELKKTGHEFRDFKLFKVAGLAPAWTYIGFIWLSWLVAELYLGSGHSFCELWPYLLMSAFMWVMSGPTRTCLVVQLWLLGASSAWPRFYGSLGFMNALKGRDMKFDLRSDQEPRVTKSKSKRDPDFDVLYLSKADGSA